MGKKKLTILCSALVGALLIGGAFAYFSGRAVTAENNFNIVKGGDPEQGDPIVINEPSWDDENAKDVEPGQIIAKDPSVENLAEYDGFIVVKVSVPTILAKMEGDEDYEVYDAFTLEGLSDEFNDWLSDGEYISHVAGVDSVYYFSYGGKKGGYFEILASGAETPALFKSIRMQDFTMVKEDLTDSINVDAAIVQKINPETGTVWEYKELNRYFGSLIADGKF